ncbi:DUF6542 domain-containing protein [Williamsia sp. D3]|uniref:DUF6542 domain-containing protein n=1 Tax=Williamsia sp. D3 TaxID=1313067 RepID=UPI0003D38BBE|nr:DUF6542 domain-containing protein [Williamsia sp. D3]ETD30088.1 hypothetical protein W823_26205 [Williamsia sp. D3]
MISGPRSRSGVPLDEQSALPTAPGVPWWGAVLLAGGLTVLGAVLALAGDETSLGFGFRALYVIGCIAAVLAVRRRALFTAVTQPPLILFVVAVVTLYFLVSDSDSGVKRLIFNVALPVAKLFPLMGWTFVAVLAIAAARVWFTHPKKTVVLTKSDRRPATGRRPAASTDTPARTRASRSDQSTPPAATTSRSRSGQAPRAGARSTEPRDRAANRASDPAAAPRRRRAVPEAPEPGRRRASTYDPPPPGARAYRAPDDLTDSPRLRYREPS